MSDKTNEEKLRILKERLNHIKQKQESSAIPKENTEKIINPSSNEIENPYEKRKLKSFGWLKYVAIFACSFAAFYAYNNIDLNSLKSTETDTTELDEVNKINEAVIPLKYNLDLQGDKIVIVSTFKDENSAKAMTNDLKIKGFKAEYFFLPSKSNSTEAVYKVFIGPYEHEEETNQWVENLEVDFEIVTL